ncbi:MAG: glycosyltransferase [Planctomycetota bacterium]
MHIMDKLSVDGSKIHGPARQIAYRARYYDPERVQLRLINLRQEDPSAELLREAGVEVINLGRGKFDLRTLGDLKREIDQWQPDVLHLSGYAAWTFGRLAGRQKGVRVVAQEHMVDRAVPKVQQVADRLLAGKQDKVLAVSSGVKRFIEDKRGIRGEVEVLYNGVPTESFEPPSSQRQLEIREELGLVEGQRAVGIVGRLAEMKGHRYFLDAAAILAKKRDDLRFVVIGDGPLRDALGQQAEELKITDRVCFAGYKPGALPYLYCMDIHVLSSVFGEGFPGVCVETFLSGTPLVMTDLPNYRGDLFEDGVNCLMVPPADGGAIAAAVDRLLDDAGLRARLLEGGRAVTQQVSFRRIAQRYTEIYESLVRPNEAA